MEPRPIRLTVIQPNFAPIHVNPAGVLITLGRATDCTVPIRDRYLSRRHAEIVFDADAWILRDLGSVNGTLLNGTRIEGSSALKPGDRITLGDSEVLFEPEISSESHIISFDSDSQAKNLAIPINDVADTTRSNVLGMLAMKFIEDRTMGELFDFILDQVVVLLQPSRAALALFGTDKKTFTNVLLRRSDSSDSLDLFISSTLLAEVVEERNVVSFIDTSMDEKLARAESIVAQDIRSAVCAPLTVGTDVMGVLYLDFLAQHGMVTHDDVHLIAQIARFAARKLETTRLREESQAKARLEEELRTAYTIQSRLLPEQLPAIDGYAFAGTNRPCRTVSGDYYDVVVRPDGRIYFIMADVSGKGITAALVMSSVATAFSIFTRNDPTPAELVRELNTTLAPKTAPTKFVTMVVGVLDPASGLVEFVNAGHVAPLVISRRGVEAQATTDLVVGVLSTASYHNQRVTLDVGDSIVLFTDGVTEAENEAEEQLGLEPIATLLSTFHGIPAPQILDRIDQHLQEFCANAPATDDVTMLALTRL
jgi:serine phosphatase RsbU (regulator of sigma subunit)/pSer/pThr/pTyr-binding forkhead associated (FHA) protein